MTLTTSIILRKAFNPLTNDKIFNETKLKAIADKDLDVAQMIEFVLEGLENIV